MRPRLESLRHWQRFLLGACLFAFVIGANWATFDRFGSDMPDWDQWDAEGVHLLAPWFEHDHFLAHLFEPHNEHRVVLTKLQNLAVVSMAKQWDSRAECCFNAVLHGLIALAFWIVGRRWITRPWQAFYYVALATLYGLPLAWQNLLGGFHSQQYWLIGLSFAGLLLLPFARPWTGSWWIGLLATTLALGSMGSGFLAAVVVVGVVVWRWLQRQITARSAWPTLVAMTGLIALGDLTRVEVYYHAHLKAKSAHDFIFSLLRSLEWPLRDQDWAGAILWLPFVAAAGYILFRRGERRSRAGQTIVALGGWVLVQLLATAYARGAGADYPASRYMDTLIFGAAVNALALGWLLSPREPRGSTVSRVTSLRVATWAIGIAWVITLAIGLRALLVRNVSAELPDTKKYYVYTESHLRGFLATDDPAELTDPIPYPSAAALMERLGHPSLRTLMPASVRPALPVKAATTNDSAFLLNRATQRLRDSAPRVGLPRDLLPLASRPTWGSFTAQGAAATGEWRSAPLTAPLGGWLRFETTGDMGRSGVTLELRDAATDKTIGQIQPSKIPDQTWRSAYVRAPHRPFVIVARDTDPRRWFAFSAPVEMSTLSYWTWQAVKNGLLLAEIAVAIAAFVGLSTYFVCRKTTRVSAAFKHGQKVRATSSV